MVAQGSGLIIMISSMGGLRYLFNVPYGVGKAAVSLSLITLCRVIVFNHCQNLIFFLFFFFLNKIIAVRSAGSRYGVRTEKEWSSFCQPVAGGCSDRADQSVCPGEGCTTEWRFPSRLLKLTSTALLLLSIPVSQMKSFCFHQMRDVFINGETTELSGRCIVNLAKGRVTPCRAARHGQRILAPDVMLKETCRQLGIVEIFGSHICVGVWKNWIQTKRSPF